MGWRLLFSGGNAVGQFNLGDCETPKPKATMFNIPDELDGRQVSVRAPVGWQSMGFREEVRQVYDQPINFSVSDPVDRKLIDGMVVHLDQKFLGLIGWVVQCVHAFPGKTPRELAAIFSNGDHKKFNRRLPEAEKKGLVRRGEFRKCSISGFATEWWPAKKA